MRNTIQKLLKEVQDYHSSVFLIMSEDEKFVKYNIHIAGDKYFNGGPNRDGWESIDNLNDKTFQEFYINQKNNAEAVMYIQPQRDLDKYKPKVVEYVMGFFRKDGMSNVFDQLTENEDFDLGWAEDIMNSPLPNFPIEGQIYRVNIPEKEKLILDILIKEVTDKTVYDETRCVIYDWDGSSLSEGQKEDAIYDYNRDSTTPLIRVKELLEEGHWYPIREEDSLFKTKSFDPHYWDYDESVLNAQSLLPKQVNESEDDFGWVDELSDEPFHKILIQNDERDFGLSFSGVDRILFNPPVEIGSREFNNVVYWLEDRDYYPNTLELNGETSYIEITKRKHANGIRNGRFRVGPVLSDQELYNLSQENTRPNWNGNIWYEQFMKEFKVRA